MFMWCILYERVYCAPVIWITVKGFEGDDNLLISPFQSAFHEFHSVGSHTSCYHIDIMSSVDKGKVTNWLSAAFDTMDHSLLLCHIQHRFQGFWSCTQFVCYLSLSAHSFISGNYSSKALLICGGHQGLILEPLFTVYTTPLGTIPGRQSLVYNFYVDVFISFDNLSCNSSVQLLSTALEAVVDGSQ